MGFILPLLIALPQAATGVIAGSIVFAAIVTALFFIVAYFFQSPQLTAIAHEELAAMFFTAFIILFWVTGSAFLNGITDGLVGATMPDYTSGGEMAGFSMGHVELAIAANDVFLTKLKSLYINLYLYEVLIGFLSTISFPILTLFPGPAMISLSFMPFISLTMLSGAHTSVVESIGLLAAMLWAKEFILLFCRDIVPLILLPIGLVMRAFPFTRTTGSSIISVCFMGYFVFPLAVLLSYYMVFDLYQPSESPPVSAELSLFKTHMDQTEAETMLDDLRGASDQRQDLFDNTPLAQDATSGTACEGYEFWCSAEQLGKWAWNGVTGFFDTVKNIWLFMMGFMGDFALFREALLPTSVAAGLYDFIIREVAHVAQFIVIVVLTSIVEIIIALTMYRNISWVIGGEMELAGITKVM